MITGSNKITHLSHTRMDAIIAGRRFHTIAPEASHPHPGREPHKKIIRDFHISLSATTIRSDITLLLADAIPAPNPKGPNDKPIRLFQRYQRWCSARGYRDIFNRRHARRFLKLMRLNRL